MMADLFLRHESPEQAEDVVISHLRGSGVTEELQHFEVVDSLPLHDARLSQLFKSRSATKSLAVTSPYH